MALAMSESDDSDMEWEQIVPNEQTIASPRPPTVDTPFEIVIQAPARTPDQSELRKKKTQADQLARVTRLAAHRFHTLALLANASIRNKWLNDTLLHVCNLIPAFTQFW
jgi:xeroderma pigmentosum group C-complementing protein